MRLKILIPLLIVINLFFSGCGKCEPQINTVYVKNKVPRLRTLYKINPYIIEDVKDLDNTHYLISKLEIREASRISQKRIRIINFYEKQNMKFNREFATQLSQK